MKSIRKLGAVAGTAIVVSLALAACSGASSTTTPDATPPSAAPTASSTGEAGASHNDADTMFAQMMIVHHEGAIEMADLAVERAASEEVRSLAEGISAAQGPEIEKMTSWLEAWGEETMSMGGMDHGGMDMDGMSQEEAMAELAGLSGVEFDRRFLELMIAHHEGAVEMAQTELEDGQNTEALALSEQIVADQEAEIAEMQQLLSTI
ncbi:DUF305 domain-containing protein [Agrococcus sp. Marseille-Q4369]|uniref:DUF305 domain-containing protein n=1 Tax=Agrococcus sp. Marseille-Q4369 TaxID=2810513 RepID=UPI001B8B2340|nr:DUF305 domain-containing protein [Agrococcus sp. Marseille-Q4369]QUW17725.1 DUF305 domain-containing protein [Agrococcus sp. Marseille-Q4369]